MYPLRHLCIPLLGLVSWVAADSFQKVLGLDPVHVAASAKGDGWSVREQYDSACKAPNRHFAGRVNVTSEKNIFFWFFESKESPNDKPVVIWLNGGPGASSLVGLFSEVGPCQVNEHSNDTVPTDYSWTDHVNLLFIDQPAGVGLSVLNNKTDAPRNLDAASPDFLKLLKVFYGDIFPQYAQVPLYIAGESFGGQYVPRYTADILREQQVQLAGPLQHVQLGGIILVNALVDESYLCAGHYDLFCTENPPNVVRFNETACRAMGAAVPECERLGAVCRASRDAQVCSTASAFCMENIDVYFQAEMEALRRSPYDLRHDCPEPPLCGVGESMGSLTDYVNRPEIQHQLGFETLIKYRSINFELNSEWAADPKINVPTTSDLTFILDAGVDRPQGHIDPEYVVPVLVVNGEYDVSCNVPGQMALYDNLRWHRQAAYRAEREWKKWYWSDLEGRTHEGGEWKGTPQRQKGLEFVTIKDAGHMAPGDQPGAVVSIFSRWVANGGLLKDGDLGQPAE